MLVIRRKQFLVLSGYVLEQFQERVATELRAKFPDKLSSTGPAQLRELIEQCTGRAAGYGLATEHDIRRYIECAVQFGPQFDTAAETAWAGKILRDKDLTPRQKMDRIDDYQTFVLR